VAWQLLSAETQDKVHQLLEASPIFYNSLTLTKCDGIECSPLAQFAKWADDMRDDEQFYQEYGYSAHHHWIDVADDVVYCPALHEGDENECWFEYDRDCENNDCIVGAIVSHSENVMIQASQQAERNLLSWVSLGRYFLGNEAKESVMFLIHFIADIHQPLHACRKNDYGGDWIPVDFFGQDHYFWKPLSWPFQLVCAIPIISNLFDSLCSGTRMHLHRVWDAEIIEKKIKDSFGGSRKALEEDLLQFIQNAPSELSES